jgi:hypothetical protein
MGLAEDEYPGQTRFIAIQTYDPAHEAAGADRISEGRVMSRHYLSRVFLCFFLRLI